MHWAKSNLYLFNRSSSHPTTSTFSNDFMSGAQFSSMCKHISDNYQSHARSLRPGHRMRIDFDSAPGLIGPVEWVYTRFSNRFSPTQRFTVVFKRIRGGTSVLPAGSIIILTAYPIL